MNMTRVLTPTVITDNARCKAQKTIRIIGSIQPTDQSYETTQDGQDDENEAHGVRDKDGIEDADVVGRRRLSPGPAPGASATHPTRRREPWRGERSGGAQQPQSSPSRPLATPVSCSSSSRCSRTRAVPANTCAHRTSRTSPSTQNARATQSNAIATSDSYRLAQNEGDEGDTWHGK